MSEIHNIPNITTNGGGIPYIENGVPIQVNGTGIPFVQKIQSTNTTISSIDTVGTNGIISLSATATATGTGVALTHLEENTGQKLSGNGIPAGATIRTIVTTGASNNGTITISSAATVSASGV